jgi:uncharacterized protein DUF3150
MALTWDTLFLSGSVLSLSASQWLARLKTKPADFGIADSDAVHNALTLGAVRLAPHESFATINEVIGKAKRAVDYYSLTFGFIYGSRYVPEKNMTKLLDRLKELQAEFDAAVATFVGEYDATKTAMLPVIEAALREASKSEEAATNAIARVRQQYPTASQVRSKFGLYWQVYAIQGPKTAGADTALASEGETVKSVVAEMVGQLRTEVTEKLADVLSLVQKGGALKAVSIEAALAVLDRIDTVNVLGDATLTAQVKSLRAALKGIEPGKRIEDATVQGLQDIQVELSGSIDDAIKAAEAKLTGAGRRKLTRVSGKAA